MACKCKLQTAAAAAAAGRWPAAGQAVWCVPAAGVHCAQAVPGVQAGARRLERVQHTGAQGMMRGGGGGVQKTSLRSGCSRSPALYGRSFPQTGSGMSADMLTHDSVMLTHSLLVPPLACHASVIGSVGRHICEPVNILRAPTPVSTLTITHTVALLCHFCLSQGQLVVIDVSQSVDLDHPKALDFLREDCAHVNDYFRWGLWYGFVMWSLLCGVCCVGFVVWGLLCGVCYVGFVMWGLWCGCRQR
jgi:hypothetical protein